MTTPPGPRGTRSWRRPPRDRRHRRRAPGPRSREESGPGTRGRSRAGPAHTRWGPYRSGDGPGTEKLRTLTDLGSPAPTGLTESQLPPPGGSSQTCRRSTTSSSWRRSERRVDINSWVAGRRNWVWDRLRRVGRWSSPGVGGAGLRGTGSAAGSGRRRPGRRRRGTRRGCGAEHLGVGRGPRPAGRPAGFDLLVRPVGAAGGEVVDGGGGEPAAAAEAGSRLRSLLEFAADRDRRPAARH